MKCCIYIFTCCLFICSCTNSGKTPGEVSKNDTIEKKNFFPVTAYLKGEIYNIKKAGINPLKFTMMDGHTDSVWLKIEELDSAVDGFLHPVIDSANLTALFNEKTFLDRSLNAVTFTYDAAGTLPDTMQLKHWDVYVDPKSNKVKRIYMIKEIDKSKTLQLTWVSGAWCKTTTIITDEKGAMKVEKEEKITWDF